MKKTSKGLEQQIINYYNLGNSMAATGKYYNISPVTVKNILERNGAEFHMVYYNVLEMLREWHSQSHDEADIPFAKAYRIYTDENYYGKFSYKNDYKLC